MIGEPSHSTPAAASAEDSAGVSVDAGATGRPKERPAENHQNPQRDEDEIGGPKGPEPTRFGDWERKGRCIDF